MLTRRPGAAARGGPEHHGHLGLAAEHVAHLGGLVHQLIHTDGDEVGELDFGHGTHSGNRRADGRPHDGRLADGSVPNALGPEFLDHPHRNPEGPAVNPDIFAHHEHRLIPAHFDAERLAYRFGVGYLPHAYTSSAMVSKPGSGLF